MGNFLKNFDLRSVLLIAGLALFDTFGQFAFKKYKTISKGNYKNFFLLAGFISYLLYSFCIFNLVQIKKLATSGILHTLSHFIVLGLLFALGKFYFREKYSWREMCGLGLGLASIYILLSGSHGHGHGHGHSH
tara:strand:+ start:84 stop:482 length:399 start_codon:yes stop_codon:yes gene_type:complete